MNALSIRALVGVAGAGVATIGVLSVAPVSVLSALVPVIVAAGLGLVAFAAQSRRLREAERLVYRPVYVRRHDVQRRVMSGLE